MLEILSLIDIDAEKVLKQTNLFLQWHEIIRQYGFDTLAILRVNLFIFGTKLLSGQHTKKVLPKKSHHVAFWTTINLIVSILSGWWGCVDLFGAFWPSTFKQFYQLIETIVLTSGLSILVYYVIKWLIKRFIKKEKTHA